MWGVLSKSLRRDLIAVILLTRNKFLCANLSLFSAVSLFFASFSFSFLAISFRSFNFSAFGLKLEDRGGEACLIIIKKDITFPFHQLKLEPVLGEGFAFLCDAGGVEVSVLCCLLV